MSGSVVIGVVVVTGGLYAVGSMRLGARTVHTSRFWKTASGLSGFAILAALQLPSLHHLGQELFTFHMIAHILLAGVAAPLLVLAEPVPPLLWSLPRQARSAIGLALSRMAAWKIHVMAIRPIPAAALHAVAVWAWHVPALYDFAVRNEAAHWLQHASFLVTALFLWSAVLRDRVTGIVVLLVTLIHTGLLGALLTFSPAALYHSHAPELWGLTDLEDQQLAGLIMWVPASFIYLAAALALAASLLQEQARPRSGRVP